MAKVRFLTKEQMLTGDGVPRPRRVQGGGVAFLACPYCGTLNPPAAVKCGTGRSEGCGAPLREQ